MYNQTIVEKNHSLFKTHSTITYELWREGFKTRGYNRMWIVDNSVKVLDKISKCNKRKVKNVRTYDFSTLYTSIPHSNLKSRIRMAIEQVFNNSGRRYIRFGKGQAK